jgi:hypothetical protein
MPLIDLTDDERHVVLQCLRAAVAGPFFPMWEFSTLFGLSHQQVADIAFAPGPLDDTREDVRLAINNALSNLTGYPHRCAQEVWERFVPVAPGEVRRIFRKWKHPPGEEPGR